MVRRLLGLVMATVVVLLPHVAWAQKGQQIFDFFCNRPTANYNASSSATSTTINVRN